MSVSEDPTTGTNQKASAFWTRVYLQYNKNVAKANKNREDDPTWRDLPEDRLKGSLKSQWYTRLQPSIQKFAGIVAKHPPASGQLKDDVEMDLYWKSIRVLYTNQATDGLPKKFTPYMQAYFFLSNHPKFASVLEANERSGAKKKGCRSKGVSDVTSPPPLSSQKFPSSTVVQSDRPIGRDSAKKSKATEFVIDKVTEGVASALGTHATPSVSLKTIEEGLSKANDVMQTLANHQVMALAPPDVCEQYFGEVFDYIQAQARNKRLRLQMENEEMALRIKRLYDERTSTVGCGDVADGDKKMPAVEQPDNDKGLDVEKQQPVTVGVLTINEDICNYPDCLIVNGGPPLDVCQGFCGGRHCFHHACNVNWLESKNIDAELCKLCYYCVNTQYGDV